MERRHTPWRCVRLTTAQERRVPETISAWRSIPTLAIRNHKYLTEFSTFSLATHVHLHRSFELGRPDERHYECTQASGAHARIGC
jgi:hypothetical protein